MKKILTIDDEPIQHRLIQAVFNPEEGYEVITAPDGFSALELAPRVFPDAVILDYNLPGMGGMEVLLRLKQIQPNLPVIMLTGRDEVPTAVEALKLGAHHYVVKPFRNNHLLMMVQHAIESSEMAMKLEEQRREMKQLRLEYTRNLQQNEIILEEKVTQLEEALAKVKQLEGILPICMHCKKIRDGYEVWNQLEVYISQNSQANFSHGICPDCLIKFYPEPSA